MRWGHKTESSLVILHQFLLPHSKERAKNQESVCSLFPRTAMQSNNFTLETFVFLFEMMLSWELSQPRDYRPLGQYNFWEVSLCIVECSAVQWQKMPGAIPLVWQPNMSPDVAKCPLGGKIIPNGNHYFREMPLSACSHKVKDEESTKNGNNV